MKRSLSALAALAFLAGCSLAPVYQRPAAPVDAQWPTGAAYPLPRAGDHALAAADIAWRDYFADQRLRTVIALALANNRDLRVSVLNIEKSRAQYGIQRAALLPTVSASVSQSATRVPAGENNGNAAIDRQYSGGLVAASYELDFFGRVRSLSEAGLQTYLGTGGEARRANQFDRRRGRRVADLERGPAAFAAGGKYAQEPADQLRIEQAPLRRGQHLRRRHVRGAEQRRSGAQRHGGLHGAGGGRPERLDAAGRRRCGGRFAAAGRAGADQPTGGDSGRAAVGPAATPARCAASRTHAARRQRQHRRGPRGLLPQHIADGIGGQREQHAVRIVQGRLGGVEFYPADYCADLRRRRPSRQPRYRQSGSRHLGGAVRKGDPERLP